MKPVRALGREYSMAILGATETPASVTQLSESLDIPVATCYRRVGELAAVGLLEEAPSAADDASRAVQYRRTTDAVGIRFAPVPSLFAWTCVREAVGTDASSLERSTGAETQSPTRSATDGFAPATAAATEQHGSTGNDA
ncbi:winged helix-turn-helix domain-containing protein [Haloplanus sp.]|uniref:winged helix-turn-helix domain-containing protein n=1 Tax=Haloplanus sp. TaxID=1961696 RepID=UPI0026105E2F|nr:helix-turn-helix domain-containing protein [Haloplanus sp.]